MDILQGFYAEYGVQDNEFFHILMVGMMDGMLWTSPKFVTLDGGQIEITI